MKGIILAGGAGTRLFPLTLAISKQLLPIHDKPMIYYPLSVLMLAGIREILVITTPRDRQLFESLLRDGGQFGVSISYATQERPLGIAHAFLIARKFIGGDRCALVLGDNIFYGHGLSDLLKSAAGRMTGAAVFAYEVIDPQRYGVVTFNPAGEVTTIEEKPKNPKSRWAITGLYFYDSAVLDYAAELKPSARGELEITDINRRYLQNGRLQVERMGRGFAWLDTGTVDSLREAGEFVAALERRQGLKICCPEEVALRSKFVSLRNMEPWLGEMQNSSYADYVRSVAQEL